MFKNFFKKIRAFTLIELTVVLAISSMLTVSLLAGYFKYRKVLITNQTNQLILDTLKLSRKQSMLIRRSDKDYWVYGIGIKLEKKQKEAKTYWELSKIKYVSSSVAGGIEEEFYKSYQEDIVQDSQIVDLDDSSNIIQLDSALNLQLKRINNDFDLLTDTELELKDINKNCTKIYIIFETLNGTPHIYCDSNSPESKSLYSLYLTDSKKHILIDQSGLIILGQQIKPNLVTLEPYIN